MSTSHDTLLPPPSGSYPPPSAIQPTSAHREAPDHNVLHARMELGEVRRALCVPAEAVLVSTAVALGERREGAPRARLDGVQLCIELLGPPQRRRARQQHDAVRVHEQRQQGLGPLRPQVLRPVSAGLGY